MPITITAGPNNDGFSTSASVGWPSGRAVGDYVLIQYNSGDDEMFTAEPAGLTRVSYGSANNLLSAVYIRQIDGTESGTLSWTHTGGSDHYGITTWLIKGADSYQVTFDDGLTFRDVVSMDSITVAAADSLGLLVVGSKLDAPYTYPSGYAILDGSTINRPSCDLQIATKGLPAGPTGSQSVGLSSKTSTLGTFVVFEPASGGGGAPVEVIPGPGTASASGSPVSVSPVAGVSPGAATASAVGQGADLTPGGAPVTVSPGASAVSAQGESVVIDPAAGIIPGTAVVSALGGAVDLTPAGGPVEIAPGAASVSATGLGVTVDPSAPVATGPASTLASGQAVVLDPVAVLAPGRAVVSAIGQAVDLTPAGAAIEIRPGAAGVAAAGRGVEIDPVATVTVGGAQADVQGGSAAPDVPADLRGGAAPVSASGSAVSVRVVAIVGPGIGSITVEGQPVTIGVGEIVVPMFTVPAIWRSPQTVNATWRTAATITAKWRRAT